jgi:hypothetical protein
MRLHEAYSLHMVSHGNEEGRSPIRSEVYRFWSSLLRTIHYTEYSEKVFSEFCRQ